IVFFEVGKESPIIQRGDQPAADRRVANYRCQLVVVAGLDIEAGSRKHLLVTFEGEPIVELVLKNDKSLLSNLDQLCHKVKIILEVLQPLPQVGWPTISKPAISPAQFGST